MHPMTTCCQLATPKHTSESIAEVLEGMPCKHNNWDNVRVVRGHMTLRCRVCQLQWRAPVGMVWEALYCVYYRTHSGCKKGRNCCRLHINGRKLSEAAREKRKVSLAKKPEAPPTVQQPQEEQPAAQQRGRSAEVQKLEMSRAASCNNVANGRGSPSVRSASAHSTASASSAAVRSDTSSVEVCSIVAEGAGDEYVQAVRDGEVKAFYINDPYAW